MRKYKLLKNLRHGTKIWRYYGPETYLFRATPVPGIHHYGGPIQGCQRHHQQLREHYSSNSLRIRLENWDCDYDRVRVNPSWLDPWDYERQRPLIKNWKKQRRTQYHHCGIDRRIHAPAYWNGVY